MPFTRNLFAGCATAAAIAIAAPGYAQSGLRLPERGEPGLDPSFARGWLAPDYDRFGFAVLGWREALRFAPAQRMGWSYSFGERASLGLSLGEARDSLDERRYSLYGSYWLSPDWAVSAETIGGRDASGLFRLQDIRIGVQRRF